MRDLITAQVARNSVREALKHEFSRQVTLLKAEIDKSVTEAIEGQKYCAVVRVPESTESEVLEGLKKALKKLGYKVRIDTVHGLIDENLYRGPRTTLTIWF